MAKKGGVQQLQIEINTDEELVKFLDKDGLFVLDVYTGWCGPCLAMVGSLKKIKLEKGGDDLLLGVVKCDNIEIFARFRNKCEPTWLFASHGKLVNGSFGSNVPELMAMINNELELERKYRLGEAERIFYELSEMVPCELVRYNAKMAIQEETERIEREAAEKNRRDYIAFVTDEIMLHAFDMGVSVMMPHTVCKELVKRLPDYGEKFGLTPKDKRQVIIQPDDLEVLHFEIDQPLSPFALHALHAKEALLVCWKNAEMELRPVEEMLEGLRDYLSDPQPIDDTPTVTVPAILKTLTLELSVEEYAKIAGEEFVAPSQEALVVEVVQEEEPVVVEEKPVETQPVEAIDEVTLNDIDEEQPTGDDAERVTESEQDVVEHSVEPEDAVAPASATASVTTGLASASADKPVAKGCQAVKISPVWTPTNKRTTAAFIYLYFRQLTDHFLPPDPVPEPPHVAICFDAYKRNDLMELFEKISEDILAYGYFTTEMPTTAKLIANSTFKYEKAKRTLYDRIVVKVAKRTSHAVLALAGQGPNYVSQDTVVGLAECLQFFPPNYKNASETGEEEATDTGDDGDSKPKKKRKKKNKAAKEGESRDGENKEDDTGADDKKENDGGDEEDDDDDDDDEEGAATVPADPDTIIETVEAEAQS